MNIYEQLAELAEKAATETCDTKHPLFTHYKNDLHVIDRDVLEQDSQAGMTYVWTIKSNGCGTYMTTCVGGAGRALAEINVRDGGEGSRFYLVRCDGINSGSVKKISYNQALDALSTYTLPANYKPRRVHVTDHMKELVGERNWHSSLMASEWNYDDGVKTLLKLSLVPHGALRVQTLMLDPGTTPKVRTYLFNPDGAAYSACEAGPVYKLVEMTSYGYAQMQDANERLWNKAIKPKPTRDAEFGM